MEPAPPENAIWEELAPNLDEALNQLNDEDRHALMLRFFDRKSMRNVGAALGVSEDAAKMRVSRALDRMRAQLGVRSAACTAMVLGTIMEDRSVQAAPAQLVSRLAAMKVPAIADPAEMLGPLAWLLRTSKFNLTASAVLLAVIGLSILRVAAPSNLPASVMSAAKSQTALNTNSTVIVNRSFDSIGFNPPLTRPPKPVKKFFRVVDAETGDGLVGAKIQVAYCGVAGIMEGHDLLTDNNGVAAIPAPATATQTEGMNVFVVADWHVPKAVSFNGPEIPADYTMKLDPAMTEGGLVVDEDGRPVAGVTIRIQGPGDQPGQMEAMDFQTCPITNRADGSWTCHYIPKDFTNSMRFILKKTGYAATLPLVPVAHVDRTNLLLVISHGFTVTGQINDSQNRPIVNARIKSLNPDYDTRQTAKTDENGVFALTGVSGETADGLSREPPLETNDNGSIVIRGLLRQGPLYVKLAVQAEGFASQTTKVALSGTTNVINFTLAKGNIFRGRIVDETGYPIPNAVVRTDFDFKNQIQTQFDWLTHTDGNGSFEWDSAPAEAICYWFEADGYTVIRGMPLLADGSDHEITLTRDATK